MKTELEQQIAAACQELFGVEISVELGRPDEQFGDYATNVALQLAKPVGQNPRRIGETLAAKLRDVLSGQVSEISVAGPGFVNLKLGDPALIAAMSNEPAKSLEGQSIVAEYSDPNPFKVLHAGHLYTSVVGDAIANLLETAGANVHRVNFGGDVGLHVGKTMWAIERTNEEILNDADPDFRAGWLSRRYVEGNNAYEDDETAKAEIIACNKRIYQVHADNDHQSDFAKAYWKYRDWSYDYFKYFYEVIGIKPFDKFYPESETASRGTAKVNELLERGVLETSDGAVVFKGEAHDLHTRVFLTKEGLPTYETKDLGLILAKYDDYHFDRSVVITGNDIVEYMKVVLKVVEQFAPELSAATTHLTHGLVKLQGGEKMSSRKGNILQALDIITEAGTATRQLHPGASEETVKQATYGAVKYAFMKNRIGGDIIYDPAESVSLEGNSGPYLQYAHARARSILAKAEGAAAELADLQADERSLVRKIAEYAEVVDRAVAELMPHHICTYLYELAQTFNRFYEHNRVLGDERQATRLALVRCYADTLKNGLGLLGIPAPDKM